MPGPVLTVTKRAPPVAVDAPGDAAFELARTGAIEAALEGIITVDDKQRIVMINPAAQRMFGCTASEVLGSELSRFIPARLRESHARHVPEFDRSGAIELPRRARTDMIGLRAAIEWLARDSARLMDVKITLKLDDNDPCVSAAAAIALYRMTQEALTNIARHARAHAVHIGLTQALPWVTLTVADDGIGLPPESQWRAQAHGLIGIRERVRMFGGQIELGNRPGGGTLLTIRLPASAVPQDP